MQEFDIIKRLRICRKCGIIEPEDRFTVDGRGVYENLCQNCNRYCSREYRANNLEKVKEQQKKYRDTNADKLKINYLKHSRLSRYHITESQYNKQLELQNNQCAICHKSFEFTKPQIDHDHKCCSIGGRSCGKCLRGLLCKSCNQILGILNDDLEKVHRLEDYLKNAEWNSRTNGRECSSTIHN
jgi:hypothetical protein